MYTQTNRRNCTEIKFDKTVPYKGMLIRIPEAKEHGTMYYLTPLAEDNTIMHEDGSGYSYITEKAHIIDTIIYYSDDVAKELTFTAKPDEITTNWYSTRAPEPDTDPAYITVPLHHTTSDKTLTMELTESALSHGPKVLNLEIDAKYKYLLMLVGDSNGNEGMSFTTRSCIMKRVSGTTNDWSYGYSTPISYDGFNLIPDVSNGNGDARDFSGEGYIFRFIPLTDAEYAALTR